ncbi:hypothetical protein [Algoriphagus sp.]|uniref:hypothetical protein n=1 Tax=Algoriphagus sp. TaxID=1872435 RepID=UPI003F707738
MKTIRKISKSPFVLSMLILSLLLVSCGTETDYVSQEIGKSQISGEEIFGQIYFLNESNLFSSIPAYAGAKQKLNSLTDEQRLVYSNFTRKIYNTISEIDSEFFENFRTKMTSKDPYVIQAELTSSAEMLRSVINLYTIGERFEGVTELFWNEVKSSKYDLSSSKDIEKLTEKVQQIYTSNKSIIDYSSKSDSIPEKDTVDAFHGTCVAIVAVAVGVVAAAAWIVAAVSWVYVEVSFSGEEASRLLFPNERNPRLLNDQIVHEIVTNF